MVTWTEVPLGEIVTVTQGHTFSRKYQGFSQGRWDYFKVADIGDPKSSKYLYRAINRVETDVLQLIGATTFPKGSIVFPRVGAALLNNNKRILAVDGVTDDNVLVLTVIDGTRYYNEYVYYWLCLQDLATFCNEGLVPVIASQNVRSRLIAVPTFNEQKETAKALSDVDAYIAALEKLIVKKRAIKQGAMQELLTGKRRLPGFSGEWVYLNLAANSTLKARIGWQGLTTAEYLDEGYAFLITGTDFENGAIAWSGCHYVEKSRYDQDPNIQVSNGDVLITKDGTIGKVAIVKGLSMKATLNSGVFVVRTKGNAYDSVYVYYVLLSQIFADFLAKLAAGSTINHLYQKDFVNFEFLIPPTIQEQTAIAEVLTNMDAEIDALTATQTKAKNIKQGMMSELLTGRIRLVEAESAKVKVEAFPEREAKLICQAAEQTTTKGHSQQFDDAVMIAGIVNALYSDKYPLGRKKVQKCLYLLRRHQDESTAAFKKKAAGPYADEVRYKGGEPIARGANYIATTTATQGTIFARGKNIDQALGYITTWGKQGDIKWVVDKLKFKNVDDLELLATVDMAISDLTEAGMPASVASIKHLIATNAEWKEKLKRQTFNDANIARAMEELQTLL